MGDDGSCSLKVFHHPNRRIDSEGGHLVVVFGHR